jgi:hypothetical protein
MRDKLGIALLWMVFTLVAVAAAYYGFVVLTDAVAKMALAVIAAAAGIMTAIVTHTLQQMREREMERLRKRQENYVQIVERLGAYLRDPEQKGDDFMSAHLLTWVLGSPEVVNLTLEFMAKQDDLTLNRLLIQMRSDLNMPATGLSSLSTQGLLAAPPAQKPRGGLKAGTAMGPPPTQ